MLRHMEFPAILDLETMLTKLTSMFMKAKKRALDGEGPTLLEFKTYRFRGHWTGDPEPYRTREEVKDWKETKIRLSFTRHISLRTVLLRQKSSRQLKRLLLIRWLPAVDFALNSPEPDPAHVLDDVFFEG